MNILSRSLLAAVMTVLLADSVLAQTESQPAQGAAKDQGTPGLGLPYNPFGRYRPDRGYWLLLNKSVQDEIKISPEQKDRYERTERQVRAKHEADWARLEGIDKACRWTSLRIRDTVEKETVADLNKVVKNHFKTEQVQRFRQIELQMRYMDAFVDRIIQHALKLTDGQRKAIDAIIEPFKYFPPPFFGDRDARAKAEETAIAQAKAAMDRIVAQLTAEQKKSWEQLIGPPFAYYEIRLPSSMSKLPFYQPSFFEDDDGLNSIRNSDPRCLLDEKLQQELKLSREQIAALKKAPDEVLARHAEEWKQLEQKYQQNSQAGHKLLKTIEDEWFAGLTAELKPDQVQRLKQIQFRMRGPEVFDDKEVQKKLQLGAEQRKAIENIVKEEWKKRGAVLKEDEPKMGKQTLNDFKEAWRKDRAGRAERNEKLGVLKDQMWDQIANEFTAEQKKAWQELAGPPFRLKSSSPDF